MGFNLLIKYGGNNPGEGTGLIDVEWHSFAKAEHLKNWLVVDLRQMAVLVRSSSFLRMRSTSEVARGSQGRNRLLARSGFDSQLSNGGAGCACGEAVGR